MNLTNSYDYRKYYGGPVKTLYIYDGIAYDMRKEKYPKNTIVLSTVPPIHPVDGQVYVNRATDRTYIYKEDKDAWLVYMMPGTPMSSTFYAQPLEPLNPTEGSLWIQR